MVALAVVLIIIAFVTADVCVRHALARHETANKRREREAALEQALQLRFADDVKSLKRVEVSEPKAHILAVDDEEVVLDSLRKILVLNGYSVDTVESGGEALTLLRDRSYDFVFTDLKMPEMDGVEVVKAVKQFRPDVDVVVVTGYASVESAVETMKSGAMDYIQKPFTAGELSEFVNRLVVRREDRIKKQLSPQIHLVTPSTPKSDAADHMNVWTGVFVAPGHTWVSIAPNGAGTVGIDDFARSVIGPIDAVELPAEGQKISKGQTLFGLHQGERLIRFPSPLSGRIRAVNRALLKSPELVSSRPYEAGWICMLEADKLSGELGSLRIGADAVAWYQEEIDRYVALRSADGSSADDRRKALVDQLLSTV